MTALCRTAPSLTRRQSYGRDKASASFLENYGWTEIFGPRGSGAGGKITCGPLLLGANTLYPRHRHLAEEIYLVLSGAADWQQGDAPWRARAPGTLVHHRSEEPHAMHTRADPLLALYLWRGPGPLRQSRLEQRGSA